MADGRYSTAGTSVVRVAGRTTSGAVDGAADATEKGVGVGIDLVGRVEDLLSNTFKRVKRLGDIFGMLSNIALAIVFLVYIGEHEYPNKGRVDVYCMEIGEGVDFVVCDSFHVLVALGAVALAPLALRLLELFLVPIPLYSIFNPHWFAFTVTSSIYVAYLYATVLSFNRNAYLLAAVVGAFCAVGCNTLQKIRLASKNHPDALSTANGILTIAGMAVVLYTMAFSGARNSASAAAYVKFQQWAFIGIVFAAFCISSFPVTSNAAKDEAGGGAVNPRALHEKTKFTWVAFLAIALQWCLVLPYLSEAHE